MWLYATFIRRWVILYLIDDSVPGGTGLYISYTPDDIALKKLSNLQICLGSSLDKSHTDNNVNFNVYHCFS